MRAYEPSSLLADPSAIWLADAPSLADDDPMAQVLPWLVQHLGVAETLGAATGLQAAPAQLLQSLQQLGFDTRLSHEPVTRLNAGDLPAVLRLRTGDACVLTALQGSEPGLRRCQVVVLTPEPMVFTVTDADLVRECAGQALLIRRPASRKALAEPAATDSSSALARTLAARRAAQAAHAERAALAEQAAQAERAALATQAERAARAEQAALAQKLAAERLVAERLAAERLVAERAAAERALAEHALAERAAAERETAERAAADRAQMARAVAERAAAERHAAARAAAQAAPPEPVALAPDLPDLPGLPVLPTLDDVIDPGELSTLLAHAATPDLGRWLDARSAAPPPLAPALPQAPEPPLRAAAPRVASPSAASPPVARPLRELPDLSMASDPPALGPPATPQASPASQAFFSGLDDPPALAPPQRGAGPVDTGPDLTLDLGFLDRQTGAGRLRGRIGQWHRKLRQGLGQLAPPWAQNLAPRSPARAAVARLHGVAASAQAGQPQTMPAWPDATAQASFATPTAPAAPSRGSGRDGGWRPRFGLGWPLGPAVASACAPVAAANASGPPPRREPTLNGPALEAARPFAWPAAALQDRDLRFLGDPPTLPSPSARYFDDPPGAADAVRRAPRRAAAVVRTAPTAASGPAPRHGATTAGPPHGKAQRLAAAMHAVLRQRKPGAAPPGRPASGSAPGRPGLQLLSQDWQQLRRRPPGRPATPDLTDLTDRTDAIPVIKPAARLRSWADDCARRGQAGWQRMRLATAAAARRWRVAARLENGLRLPLLAACSAVCLLDGLPLAWARMVSVSGLKAAACLLPGLMRQALAADQDQAVAALSGSSGAPAASRTASGGVRAAAGSRPAVPVAANAPRLAPAAGSPAAAAPALLGPSTLAMVAARAEKAERARGRGVDIATTLRRRSEVLVMGPPSPASRVRRVPAGAGSGLLAA